jgi:ferrous iron transport protein B
MRKILLIGNPNVGKSVIFNRLTGVDVITSNYPGTTVEFTKGSMKIGEEKVEIIDVPGIYSLEPISKAEEVAIKMLEEGDFIINIVDATNIERSLNLTLQLLKRRIPMIVVLNFWDETKHTGILIDIKRLQDILGVPCIPTCGITGEGIKKLAEKIREPKISGYEYDEKERWHEIGNIVSRVEKITHKHHTFWERLGDASVSPLSGIPIALGILFCTFHLVRFVGEGLIGYAFEPFFEKIWAPLMLRLSAFLGKGGFIHNILIGKLIEGEINFVSSLGLLTTGLFVPFAIVLPYVVAFYIVLSLLEDSGYLPRLAILADTLMHRIGLHGLAVIPMMLGLGCNVPGALSTRIMETKREKFIAITLMAIAVPCMSQIAVIIGLVGKYGAKGLVIIFMTLFVVWVVVGMLLNYVLKGESPEIFVEIPPYRIPYGKGVIKKIWIRIKWFLREAIPWVLIGVFILNILHTFHIINFMSKLSTPVVTGIWGLPYETSFALLVGFLRKDVAVGMLLPLNLTLKQAVVASVILTMYFPCIATFITMVRELGILGMLKSAGIMIISVIIIGGILNLVLLNL